MEEGSEQPLIPEEPLSREDVVLAIAEIKKLLGEAFNYTPLAELYTETEPIKPLEDESYRGIKRDYSGTRATLGTGAEAREVRELKAISKRRALRAGIPVAQSIVVTEPRLSSSLAEPSIAYSSVERYGAGYRPTAMPNYPTTVTSALELARAINKSR